LVRRLTATEAARQFADLLDQVEHSGETFVVERRGRPVASISPAAVATGRALTDLLAKHPADDSWAAELAELRAGLVPQERSWTG